ncbi:MAG TPA: hypothetical protein VLF91_01290 [Candidatus Saccharimonadales bacterium]|nr:hypothetical protein [Candidatus Saccharimonadales bacterium]
MPTETLIRPPDLDEKPSNIEDLPPLEVVDPSFDWLDVERPETPAATPEDDTPASPEETSAPEERAESSGRRNFGAVSVVRGLKRWLTARRQMAASAPDTAAPTGAGPARTMSEILETHEAQSGSQERRPTLAERHPDWPKKILFIAYLTSHKTKDDLDKLTQIADQEKPQIYLYEEVDGYDYIDGKSRDTRDLQSLANRRRFGFRRGDTAAALTARNRQDGTSWEAIHTMLEGRKIAVGSTDTTYDEEQELGVRSIEAVDQRPIAQNLDDELQEIELRARRAAEAQRKRDTVNVARFEDELARIFKEHPELKDQESITVLQTFGSYHTGIAQALHRDGVEVDMRFQGTALEDGDQTGTNPAYTYSYELQLQRTLAAGRQPSRELLEKSCISDYLGIALGSVRMDSSYDRNDYIRRVTDTLNADDLQEMHALLASAPEPERFRTLVDVLLAKHDAPPLARTADAVNSELTRMRTEQPTAADKYRARRSS